MDDSKPSHSFHVLKDMLTIIKSEPTKNSDAGHLFEEDTDILLMSLPDVGSSNELSDDEHRSEMLPKPLDQKGKESTQWSQCMPKKEVQCKVTKKSPIRYLEDVSSQKKRKTKDSSSERSGSRHSSSKHSGLTRSTSQHSSEGFGEHSRKGSSSTQTCSKKSTWEYNSGDPSKHHNSKDSISKKSAKKFSISNFFLEGSTSTPKNSKIKGFKPSESSRNTSLEVPPSTDLSSDKSTSKPCHPLEKAILRVCLPKLPDSLLSSKWNLNEPIAILSETTYKTPTIMSSTRKGSTREDDILSMIATEKSEEPVQNAPTMKEPILSTLAPDKAKICAPVPNESALRFHTTEKTDQTKQLMKTVMSTESVQASIPMQPPTQVTIPMQPPPQVPTPMQPPTQVPPSMQPPIQVSIPMQPPTKVSIPMQPPMQVPIPMQPPIQVSIPMRPAKIPHKQKPAARENMHGAPKPNLKRKQKKLAFASTEEEHIPKKQKRQREKPPMEANSKMLTLPSASKDLTQSALMPKEPIPINQLPRIPRIKGSPQNEQTATEPIQTEQSVDVISKATSKNAPVTKALHKQAVCPTILLKKPLKEEPTFNKANTAVGKKHKPKKIQPTTALQEITQSLPATKENALKNSPPKVSVTEMAVVTPIQKTLISTRKEDAPKISSIEVDSGELIPARPQEVTSNTVPIEKPTDPVFSCLTLLDCKATLQSTGEGDLETVDKSPWVNTKGEQKVITGVLSRRRRRMRLANYSVARHREQDLARHDHYLRREDKNFERNDQNLDDKNFERNNQKLRENKHDFIGNNREFVRDDPNFRRNEIAEKYRRFLARNDPDFGRSNSDFVRHDSYLRKSDCEFPRDDFNLGRNDSVFARNDPHLDRHDDREFVRKDSHLDREFVWDDFPLGRHDREFVRDDPHLGKHDRQFVRDDFIFGGKTRDCARIGLPPLISARNLTERPFSEDCLNDHHLTERQRPRSFHFDDDFPTRSTSDWSRQFQLKEDANSIRRGVFPEPNKIHNPPLGCKLCEVWKIEVVLFPCAHAALCLQCIRGLVKCPFCQCHIAEVRRIFLPTY